MKKSTFPPPCIIQAAPPVGPRLTSSPTYTKRFNPPYTNYLNPTRHNFQGNPSLTKRISPQASAMDLSPVHAPRSICEDAYAFVARKQAAIVKEKARQAYMGSHGVPVPQDQQDRLRLAIEQVATITRALGKDKKD